MKIAIAGFGQEGESNYRYWSADPNNIITIADEHTPKIGLPNGVDVIIGKDAFSSLHGFDLVIRTAGLAPRKINTDGKIWSATNEFFAKCPATIIGITGSKGKGTTASLIASILREAGKTVWLVGNIGKPALDILNQIEKDDIVVYELSSFQLWDIEKSPHIAVVLFIEQEHLDVHVDMDEYVNAKANIARFQTSEDVLVFNNSNRYAQMIASESNARTIGYMDQKYAHTHNNNFYYGEQRICSTNTLKIIGKHNQDNACAAIDAIWGYTDDIKVIEKGLHSFIGLPHRLQYIGEVDKVLYYDDSIATTPSATIAALRTFNQPKVVILGGSSKGSDFTDLAAEMKHHNVKAILIGDEATNIATAFQKVGFNNYEIIDNPTAISIVNRARQIARPGDVVLLSPASASFGLFKNYADRGEQFTMAVRDLRE